MVTGLRVTGLHGYMVTWLQGYRVTGHKIIGLQGVKTKAVSTPSSVGTKKCSHKLGWHWIVGMAAQNPCES